MRKIKVKIIEPIAGLADPRPSAELDEKYRRHIESINKGRQVPFSAGYIADLIGRFKARDRYGEKCLGFPRDWAFKVGDEPMIDESLAKHWEAAGICLILEEQSSSKKAA